MNKIFFERLKKAKESVHSQTMYNQNEKIERVHHYSQVNWSKTVAIHYDA